MIMITSNNIDNNIFWCWEEKKVEEKGNNRREKEKSNDEKEKDAQGSKKMILKKIVLSR